MDRILKLSAFLRIYERVGGNKLLFRPTSSFGQRRNARRQTTLNTAKTCSGEDSDYHHQYTSGHHHSQLAMQSQPRNLPPCHMPTFPGSKTRVRGCSTFHSANVACVRFRLYARTGELKYLWPTWVSEALHPCFENLFPAHQVCKETNRFWFICRVFSPLPTADADDHTM